MKDKQIDKPKWRDLSTGRRIALALSTLVQMALLGAALWDIRRRPAEEIRGPKPMWTALAFVNFVGPIAYFAFGRKR